MIFGIQGESGKVDKECLRVHIIGSAKGETKVMFDIKEKLFPEDRISTLQSDLDFVFDSYEVKPR